MFGAIVQQVGAWLKSRSSFDGFGGAFTGRCTDGNDYLRATLPIIRDWQEIATSTRPGVEPPCTSCFQGVVDHSLAQLSFEADAAVLNNDSVRLDAARHILEAQMDQFKAPITRSQAAAILREARAAHQVVDAVLPLEKV